MADQNVKLLTCDGCDYTTPYRQNMHKHKKICKGLAARNATLDSFAVEINEMKEEVTYLREQLKEKDKQISEKDKQIAALIARKGDIKITNNNGVHITQNNLNTFGHDSYEHITQKHIDELLRDPVNSVAKLARLRLSLPENRNVMIPNIRDKNRAKVFKEVNGEKKWVYEDAAELLEDMWEENMSFLEGNIDESTKVGTRWFCWADKVRGDQGERGPRWKEQMDMLQNTILDLTRS